MFLLLWGTLLVRQGFTRAFGMNLRQIIEFGTANRIFAFLSGLGVTALLQSSTATALLAISFAKKNLLKLSAALAVMIGADVSTTLVAQALSFDLSWISPALLSLGIFIYLSSKRKNTTRYVGRILIGLGLMLLSLDLIRQAAAPLQDSDLLPMVLSPLSKDPVFAILVSAILTWVMHSSLAAVLLFASLAHVGVFNLELGLLFVVGANLGGALVPFVVTFRDGPIARQISMGNILMRIITAALILILFTPIIAEIRAWPFDISRQIVMAHTAFNVVLAILFLPLVSPLSAFCTKLMPYSENNKDENQPQYLDDKALDTPAIALASAARETLRIAELVEDMLEKTITAFAKDDKTLIHSIREADDQVDAIYRAIKLYMTRLSAESFDKQEADRYMQILTFSTNLEHIGDIIDKSLMDLAEKKIRKQEKFSDKGFEEIQNFHDQVLENLKLAQAIFMSEDSELASRLVAEKHEIRKAAAETSEQHFKRLAEGKSETLATSSLHLDIIRDYRRINSYATRVAYTIIENRKRKRKKKPIPVPTS